jgi:quercetin dioxygenase-like cupin family protein
MALQHAASGDKIALRRSDDDIASFTSVALAKTAQMELIRMMLPKGKSIPEHKVDGQCTILCLEGTLVVQAEGKSTELKPSEMVWLERNVPHAVVAEEDSVGLLTILL